MIKLNLGSGSHLLPDHVNIDQLVQDGVEFGDITALDKYGDGTVDHIYAAHVIQCFHDRELVPVALAEWYRVLKPGGTLMVEVPNPIPMTKLYLEGKLPHETFIQGTYGDTAEGNLQTTCFSVPYLDSLLLSAGFVDTKHAGQPSYSIHDPRTNLVMLALK